MKIILDTDGTVTDFNKFVIENAYSFFQQKYNMIIKYPEKLEIEDIFDMDNFFKKKFNCDDDEARQKTKEALDKFWISIRFVKFSLLSKFRPGTKEFIQKAIKNGHQIEIHTSRGKTCENNIVGEIARKLTIIQYQMNGIFLPQKHFFFYQNDTAKIEGIINSNADLVFDDKPEIINQLNTSGIKCICVDGTHNKDLIETNNIKKTISFREEELSPQIKNLFGIKKISIYERAAKSDILFRKLTLLKPVILGYFKPIVLHEDRLIEPIREGIIYAPNHRSTLDPLAITAVITQNIHWAALLRFFKGEDSIFNNSKNPILCKITSNTFKKLEYFPIDRKSDNPNANNFKSIADMTRFLNANQKLGIFPEGTTRRKEGQDFGTFDDGFLFLAKKTDSWVQPITTLWIKELEIGSKVIINIGEPFKVSESVDKSLENYLKIQRKNLEENKEKREELSKEYKLRKTL